MYFRGTVHKKRFDKRISENPCKCNNAYISAVYLLSANYDAWRSARRYISDKEIDFSFEVKDLPGETYTVISVAKDLYMGTSHINLCDICDKYLISSRMFELIITAIHIRREGYDFIGIKPEFN